MPVKVADASIDACYLYLGRVLGAPLATFDRRLAGAKGRDSSGKIFG